MSKERSGSTPFRSNIRKTQSNSVDDIYTLFEADSVLRKTEAERASALEKYRTWKQRTHDEYLTILTDPDIGKMAAKKAKKTLDEAIETVNEELLEMYDMVPLAARVVEIAEQIPIKSTRRNIMGIADRQFTEAFTKDEELKAKVKPWIDKRMALERKGNVLEKNREAYFLREMKQTATYLASIETGVPLSEEKVKSLWLHPSIVRHSNPPYPAGPIEEKTPSLSQDEKSGTKGKWVQFAEREEELTPRKLF